MFSTLTDKVISRAYSDGAQIIGARILDSAVKFNPRPELVKPLHVKPSHDGYDLRSLNAEPLLRELEHQFRTHAPKQKDEA
jgi:hypothetical protein